MQSTLLDEIIFLAFYTSRISLNSNLFLEFSLYVATLWQTE